MVHANGGFEIRHWLSNSNEVLERIGEQNPGAVKSFTVDKGGTTERVLGMVWLLQDDVFSFAASFRPKLQHLLDGTIAPTKRELLSVVMSIFDPLGLVAVFVIHGKILVQDVWRAGIGWDEKIPTKMFSHWQRWIQLLGQLDQVRIPRCYFPDYSKGAYESLELHVFVDASEIAYAAAAYFRVVDQGVVRCILVSSKTKVAPLKPLSVPRLELQAAVIGTRLRKSIVSNHTLPIKVIWMWTDSKVTLAWLRSDLRRYKPYVGVRADEILEDSKISDWRWVPSKWNVADEATKWGKGPQLGKNSRWFQGPEFLYEDEDKWPQSETTMRTTSEELRIVHVHRQFAIEQIVSFQRFSKWERLVRTLAWVRRFYANCQRKRSREAAEESEILSSYEVRTAEAVVWQLVQADAFRDETAVLKRNQQVRPDQQKWIEKGSHLYKLSPFLGEDGVIRMDSRICEAPSSYTSENMKFPVILPKKHYATMLLIDWFHRKFKHANAETIVNEIRQKYYIPELRVYARNVANHCQWCKIYKVVPQAPRMAPLPAVRVTPYVKPFTFVGIDYFGPLMVNVKRSSVKRWVALFTCLTVRAVHLEVAFSLSTESCKMAIRRFIAARGNPQEIHSDQGTNFKGASRELSEEIRSINLALAGTFTNAVTQWKFNPPYAPHMGGAWERLVRSVKTAAFSIAITQNPDDETLLTVLKEAAAMVNSRPLTYMPLDYASQEALTPNHFLMLSSSGVQQPVKLPTDERITLKSNWNQIRVMLDQFWTRWIREYLPVISRRTKWFGETKPILVGDMVIIVNENIRNSWTRGKVVRVYPGRDGRVRRVDVQTSEGLLQRPVTRIAVLDVLGENGIAEGISSNTGGSMFAPKASETVTNSVGSFGEAS